MKRLITILSIAMILTGCGASHKKLNLDDPWPEFSYETMDTYLDGKIVEVEYSCFIGIGQSTIRSQAESKAEADAKARMAEAFRKDRAKLSGVTRVGETIIRFNEDSKLYTVYLRVGVPKQNIDRYKKK